MTHGSPCTPKPNTSAKDTFATVLRLPAQPAHEICSLRRTLVLHKLANHLVLTQAALNMLKDREKPCTNAQLEQLAMTLSETLDVALNQ